MATLWCFLLTGVAIMWCLMIRGAVVSPFPVVLVICEDDGQTMLLSELHELNERRRYSSACNPEGSVVDCVSCLRPNMAVNPTNELEYVCQGCGHVCPREAKVELVPDQSWDKGDIRKWLAESGILMHKRTSKDDLLALVEAEVSR